jgi:hypothetical protein
VTISQDYEWGAGNRERDHHLINRDHMLCALEDHGGPMAPQDLARLLGVGVSNLIARANRWPSYFEVESVEGGRRRVVRIGLHRHLAARMTA